MVSRWRRSRRIVPVIRRDHPDRGFATRAEKEDAVLDEIRQRHRSRQPVLVGTSSVEESERLSARLRDVPHQVLNARHEEAEAAIVARAGEADAVTISTNMAGRGVDIRLGAGVAELGGLHVIGTNRHESGRIDRQLRGRAGRQGDPGSSQFFVSLAGSAADQVRRSSLGRSCRHATTCSAWPRGRVWVAGCSCASTRPSSKGSGSRSPSAVSAC